MLKIFYHTPSLNQHLFTHGSKLNSKKMLRTTIISETLIWGVARSYYWSNSFKLVQTYNLRLCGVQVFWTWYLSVTCESQKWKCWVYTIYSLVPLTQSSYPYRAVIIQVYLVAMRNFHKVCSSCSGFQNNFLEKRKFHVFGFKSYALWIRSNCNVKMWKCST